MRLLTVVTVSYLYQAEVLINSAQSVHPELCPTILVSDCTRDGLNVISKKFNSDVELLCCADLEYEFIEDMREYYSVLEFCSALKVLGSAHILKSENSCLFLDPDMVVLDSISDAILNQSGEIVISSHTVSPYPDDGALPNNLELFLAGFINGGVLLTRNGKSGNKALDWLVAQTRFHWFLAPDKGMYADQQWLSSLLFLFNETTAVISDRGVNVAYWNLHERGLCQATHEGNVFLKTGEPLRLMHFSGFPVPANGKLSNHTTRYFDNDTELAIKFLVSRYEKSLCVADLKFSGLSGDIEFVNLPLEIRLRLASSRWGAEHLVHKNNISKRFKLIILKLMPIFIYKKIREFFN